MKKNLSQITEKIRRYKNRILYGSLIAGAAAAGPSMAKLVRFQSSAIKILMNEGAYADSTKIERETKFGVTNPTLQAFKKSYPKEAEGYPKTVQNLSVFQANKLIRIAFYEHYKIDEIKNKSLADMLLDAVYNHEYQTFRGFVKEGLIAVKKMRHEDIETRPRNWKDVPDFLNKCNSDEQKKFYDTFVQKRIDFLNREGYLKKYKGLKKRAAKFAGKYRAYLRKQTNTEVRIYAYLEKYFSQKDELLNAQNSQGNYQKDNRKTEIAWKQAVRLTQNSRA